MFKTTIFLFLSSFIAGCAAPITLYSTTPQEGKMGKVHFVSPSNVFTTFALYKDNLSCKGIQRVTFFAEGVDKAVYLPKNKYITFSSHVQTRGFPSFKTATIVYSAPFYDDLRVTIFPSENNVLTQIDKLAPNGQWIPAEGVIKRTAKQPFLESGDWCERTTKLN